MSIKLKTVLFLVFNCCFLTVWGQDNNDAIKTVVIDAGHGGRDPGCIGRYLKEKDVALRISLNLGKFIKEAYPQTTVIYTRDKDVFVDLDKRARIANDNDADLFISIHANAASPSAYGTETFVLGLHRSESQQKVAERENSIIHFEENSQEKYSDFDMSPDAIIARQIQLSVFLDQSISFASLIQDQFGKIGRKDRGVKQAGFIVLYKTTMPSVLIEAGFLTNPAEEQYLRDTLNQIKLANSIFKAFQVYKNDVEGVQRLIVDGVGFNEAVEEHSKRLDAQQGSVKQEEKPSGLVFKVQIETSKTRIKPSDPRFRGLAVWEYQQDGLFKYTSGSFKHDFDSAKEHRTFLQKQGFEHAFIIAFLDGERIPITDALKMLK